MESNISDDDRIIKKSGGVYAFQRSELLDCKTCNVCISMDGRIVDKGDPITRIKQFCPHCRGIWVGILNDEANKPPIEGIPQAIRDLFDIRKNEVTPMNVPVVKEKGLAAKWIAKGKKGRQLS